MSLLSDSLVSMGEDREIFEVARREGYYTWPRDTSASALADEMGVSKTTFLEHLRKAEAKLLGEGD